MNMKGNRKEEKLCIPKQMANVNQEWQSVGTGGVRMKDAPGIEA